MRMEWAIRCNVGELNGPVGSAEGRVRESGPIKMDHSYSVDQKTKVKSLISE